MIWCRILEQLKFMKASKIISFNIEQPCRQTDSKPRLLLLSYVHSFTVCTLGPFLRLRALLGAVCRHQCGGTSSLDGRVCKVGGTDGWRANRELKIVQVSPKQRQTQSRTSISILTFFPILFNENLHGTRVSNGWGMRGKRGSAVPLLKAQRSSVTTFCGLLAAKSCSCQLWCSIELVNVIVKIILK